MSHSQLFGLQEEKKKQEKSKEEIVPKEFHEYLETVFSEREVGRLPPRSRYDHKIDLKEGFIPMRGPLFHQTPDQDEHGKQRKRFHMKIRLATSLNPFLYSKERWKSQTRPRLSISKRLDHQECLSSTKDR